MILSLVLFENEFLNIVAISFTALVLNELIMVALEITTWYVLRIRSADRQALVHDHLRNRHAHNLLPEHCLPAGVLRCVQPHAAH